MKIATNNPVAIQVCMSNARSKSVPHAYAGELVTQAVGMNPYVAFTSNFVQPASPVQGGFGRNFVARQLLDVTNFEDALAAVSMDGQCAGHGRWKPALEANV